MPISQATAPPKRATARKSSAEPVTPTTVGVSPHFQRRKEGVEGIGQAASLILLIRQQYADAQAVGMHTSPIATELARLGETNESIGKWLDYFSMSGPYSGLVKATLPLVLQLLANHGTIKAEAGSMLGVVSPKTLELAGKAEQEKVETALLLQIQESQRETAALKDQLQKEMGNDSPN